MKEELFEKKVIYKLLNDNK